MIQVVGCTLRWVLSLGKKFTLVVPAQTLLIVLLTLVSQVSALLASFLPLKVVILLGSENIPGYFPGSWSALNKDVLIVLLCLTTLGFYALHLLSVRLISWITAWGTKRLLQSSHKMALFDNQEEVAREAYQRFSRALASGVFVILAITLLVIFYTGMAGIVLGFLLLAGLCFQALYATSDSFRHTLENNLAGPLNLVGMLGFLFAFGYLVIDYIYFSPPSVIIAIVGLLLSRQMMQRATNLVGDLANLQRKKIKLDALFFHGKVFLPDLPNDRAEFWSLLQPAARRDWVAALLKEFSEWNEGHLAIRWQQTDVPYTAAFLVETDKGDFWINLFDKKRNTLALHESTLLVEKFPNLPALPLLGTTQLGSLHCLIYALPKGIFPTTSQSKKIYPQLISSLWSVELTPVFQERYLRSHPVLWQRMRLPLLEKIHVAVSDDLQQQQLNAFLCRYAETIKLLQTLPLVIVTKHTGDNNLYLNELSEPVLLSWGRWSLESIGAGFPLSEFEQLENVLVKAQKTRPELESLTLEQVKCIAMLAELEDACVSQKYKDALVLLPDLLPLLDNSLRSLVAQDNLID